MVFLKIALPDRRGVFPPYGVTGHMAMFPG